MRAYVLSAPVSSSRRRSAMGSSQGLCSRRATAQDILEDAFGLLRVNHSEAEEDSAYVGDLYAVERDGESLFGVDCDDWDEEGSGRASG